MGVGTAGAVPLVRSFSDHLSGDAWQFANASVVMHLRWASWPHILLVNLIFAYNLSFFIFHLIVCLYICFENRNNTRYKVSTSSLYFQMKVLIVDDAPHVLEVLKDLLEAYGHEIYDATNGEDAIRKYKEISPNAVLMDVLMPRLDGINTTRRILDYDPHANIIIITAVGRRGLEQECINAGAKSFIAKPFKTKDLIKSIESMS